MRREETMELKIAHPNWNVQWNVECSMAGEMQRDTNTLISF